MNPGPNPSEQSTSGKIQEAFNQPPDLQQAITHFERTTGPGTATRSDMPSLNLLPTIGSSWTEIGPKPIQNGLGHFTWGTAPFSGRVSAIAVNATNPLTIYVGGAQGGVWKSTNGGSTWTPLMDSSASLAVGAITISPDGKTIYVGTGEPNHSGDSYFGAGLLKSANEGGSWAILGSNVFAGSAISAILINPSNPNDILVSTTWASCCKGLAHSEDPAGVGVFRSTDGGITWSLTLSESGGTAELVVDPNNSNVVYAGDFSGQVWRTVDYGISWGSPILYYSTPADQGRVAVALSGSLPNVIFAAFANQTGALLGIFKDNLTSAVITPLGYPPNPPLLSNNTPCGPAGETQCVYDLVLSVDPTNPSNLFFGGVDLYLSSNQGSTWTDLGGYTSGSGLHPDQHALFLSPSSPGTIWEGNDGGLWSSTNYGGSWTDRNSGLGLTQFESVAASPNSATSAIGGTQDNACVQYSGSLSWDELTSGDGGWSGFESSNPSIMYCDYTRLNVQRSIDGGSSWSWARTGINLSDNSLFYAPVAQDPNNPGTLYIGGTHVYKTTNYASSWFDASGFIGLATISALAVAPSNSNIVYLGDVNGNLKVTNNGGTTWSTVATEGYPVSSITVNSTNSQVAYAALAEDANPVLLKTTNGGGLWQTLALTGFPSVSINVVKFDPTSVSLFVGTDGGTFYSSNGGNSWSQLGSGLPNAAVFDIAFTHSDSILAATHGRGVWELPHIIKQVALTLSYTVSGGSSGYTTPTLTYTNNGVPRIASLTTISTAYQADYGTTWSVTTTLGGSGSTERWSTNQTAVGSALSNFTANFVYYHQYKVSFTVSPIGAGTTVPSGSALWENAGPLSISANPNTGYAFSKWNATTGSSSFVNPSSLDTTAIVSGTGTIIANFFHGVTEIVTIVSGPSNSPSALISISGCHSTVSSIVADGSPHSFAADSSCSLRFTAPGDTSTNRYRFSPLSTSWVYTTASSGTDTKSNNVFYQDVMACSYLVVGGGFPTPPTLTYSYLGDVQTPLTLTSTPVTCYPDHDTTWSVANPTGGSTPTERWFTTSGSGTSSPGGSIAPMYYHQFLDTLQFTIIGGRSPSAPSVELTQFGSTNLITSASDGSIQEWVDAGSTLAYPTGLPSSSAAERWYSPSLPMFAANSPATLDPNYYHQFLETLSYTIIGGGSPTAPTFTAEEFGASSAQVLTSSSTGYWYDSGSAWVISNPLGSSTISERWETGATTQGTLSSSQAQTTQFSYYHQYTLTMSYIAIGRGTPFVPTLNGTQLGQAVSASLLTAPKTYWLDSGSTWGVPSLLSPSTNTMRWLPNGTLGATVASDFSERVAYQLQYRVQVTVAAPGGGTTTPSSDWYDDGISLKLVASPASGWVLGMWEGQGPLAYSGNATTQFVMVDGAINETAAFYPGLALMNGGNGQISYQWGNNQGNLPSGTTTIYVPAGTTVSLSASPSSFLYAFNGYTGAVNSGDAASSVLISGPATVTASFGLNYIVLAVLAVIGAVVLAAIVGLVYLKRPKKTTGDWRKGLGT